MPVSATNWQHEALGGELRDTLVPGGALTERLLQIEVGSRVGSKKNHAITACWALRFCCCPRL